eukprot:GHVU01161550.1.p1 GENE.GHVU01161550.1~~GHVU01161550.1.p1  ORF type:complete len:109 (+),score=4.80 GHVU01161550.1:309-635(+)
MTCGEGRGRAQGRVFGGGRSSTGKFDSLATVNRELREAEERLTKAWTGCREKTNSRSYTQYFSGPIPYQAGGPRANARFEDRETRPLNNPNRRFLSTSINRSILSKSF